MISAQRWQRFSPGRRGQGIIRAAIKLQKNDPQGAIKGLRPTVKYELSIPDTVNSVYPAYLRGLAYLQMGKGALAAPEFQKVIDHPGVVGRFVPKQWAATKRRQRKAMRNFSISGEAPTRTFRFTAEPKSNTQNWNNPTPSPFLDQAPADLKMSDRNWIGLTSFAATSYYRVPFEKTSSMSSLF